MRILFISDILPYPPISGSSLRIYNLIKRIAQEHDVWLLSLIKDVEEKEFIEPLNEFCEYVGVVQLSELGATSRPRMLLEYLARGWPVDLRLYYSAELIEKIQSLMVEYAFDIVQIENSYMALYLESLPANMHAKTVLTLIDIDFLKQRRMSQVELKLARRVRLWLHSQMLRRWEPYYISRFDRCITMSDTDRDILLNLNPALSLETIPNGVDTQEYLPLPADEMKPALIFVGNMNYVPNVDAVIHFCRDIFPYIVQQVSDVEFWIVGNNPRPEVKQLASERIHVTGRVDDVRLYYALSTVCVVPLRAGGGTRLKITEAMALGRCVVSTLVGAEGLDAEHAVHLMIGDTPQEFADHVVLLLNNSKLRRTIANNAREFVVANYDWDVIASKLLYVYDDVSAESQPLNQEEPV